MPEPIFSAPRTKTVTLSRPIWVKGKGLPADGVQLFREGEEVVAHTDNGASWYLVANYRGRTIKVATIL
jgi:hypothetical protein